MVQCPIPIFTLWYITSNTAPRPPTYSIFVFTTLLSLFLSNSPPPIFSLLNLQCHAPDLSPPTTSTYKRPPPPPTNRYAIFLFIPEACSLFFSLPSLWLQPLCLRPPLSITLLLWLHTFQPQLSSQYWNLPPLPHKNAWKTYSFPPPILSLTTIPPTHVFTIFVLYMYSFFYFFSSFFKSHNIIIGPPPNAPSFTFLSHTSPICIKPPSKR